MDAQLAAAVARIQEQRKMGAHLFWFIPLCMLVTAVILIPVGLLAFENVMGVFHTFKVLMLFSPSFYLFWAATISSLTVPISVLKTMPKNFMDDDKSFLSIAIGLGFILFWTAVFQVLIWGSYPHGYDAKGIGHIRMIPFLPWPNVPFFQWLWR